LAQLLAVGGGINDPLCAKHGILLGRNTQLIVEGVMPDFLHIIPVGDNSMLEREALNGVKFLRADLNWILQSQNSAL